MHLIRCDYFIFVTAELMPAILPDLEKYLADFNDANYEYPNNKDMCRRLFIASHYDVCADNCTFNVRNEHFASPHNGVKYTRYATSVLVSSSQCYNYATNNFLVIEIHPITEYRSLINVILVKRRVDREDMLDMKLLCEVYESGEINLLFKATIMSAINTYLQHGTEWSNLHYIQRLQHALRLLSPTRGSCLPYLYQ